MTKNRQKPIEYDISFKYVCENCGCSHWLFLREAQAKDFQIICECLEVIKPETISNIDIIYSQDKPEVTDNNLSIDTLNQCVKTVCSLGYETAEAEDMIRQSFDKINLDNCSELIKYALKNFGASYV
jgi:hypothetical protein